MSMETVAMEQGDGGSGPLVTWENVSASAHRLAAVGVEPSVTKIRRELGGGSPNAVAPLLKRWKVERLSAQTSSAVVLDPGVQRAIVAQITAEAMRAANASEERADKALERADQLEANLTMAQGKLAELEVALTSAREQIHEQARQLAERTADVEKARAEAQSQIEAADARATRERELADQLHQQFARAQIRIEAIPRLEQRASALQQELDATREQLASARQTTAVSEEKLLAEGRRADGAEIREQAVQTDIRQLREQLANVQSAHAVAASALAGAKERASACTARVEDLERQVQRLQCELSAAARDGADKSESAVG